MSNWLTEFDDEQLAIDELNSSGLPKQKSKPREPGLFDGVATAIPRGAVAGAVKVVDTVSKPFERVKDHLQYSINDVVSGGLEDGLNVSEPSFKEFHADKNKERRNQLVMEIEQLQDAQNTGVVGNFLFSASDMLTRGIGGGLVAGPVGAVATVGSSEGVYSYEELVSKGVDSETAMKVAGVDAAVAGVSTVLPASFGWKGYGGLIRDGIMSTGIASGLSIGGQAVSGGILESKGYEKQAKKYEITAGSVTTDILLNMLFFGAARGASHYFNNSQGVDLTSDQISTLGDLQRTTLLLNEMEFEDALSPVEPSNAIQHNNHIKNLKESTEAIRMGRPINVPNQVNGEEKSNPVRISPSEYSKIRYDDPRLDSMLHSKAKEMDMDWAVPLLLSIRRAGEKSHNWQVSPVGAQSIMQIMPDTKAGLERNYKKKWDINNPEHATEMALYLVREMSQQYKTKDPLVLAAHYNGGFANGKAMQKNGKPKALETINYVNRVKDFIGTGKYKNYTGNNISTAMGMDGSSYDFAYEVKSLDELIASNDLAYGVNPNYPSELQPRDRTREASRQQIEQMANDLKPEWLGESSMLSNGAPIIGMDGIVESGNGRTLAIGKAYESGKADAYQQFVADYATSKGIDITGINKPVLVRTRLTDTDRVQFARLANESDVAQFSATERAVSDVDRLPDSSMINFNSDGSVNLDGSMDFVRGFISSLPKAEQAAMMTAEGRLNQEGKRRIESALVQRAYGDSSLVTRLAESLDDDSKTVLNALLRNAPKLAQLSDLVKQGGRHQNTLSSDLAQAAQKLSDLKANGQNVQDYLNQGQLIDDGLTPGAREFLNVFDQNKRSAKGISENIQTEIDRIESMGDPRQGSLFGDSEDEQEAFKLMLENPDQVMAVSRLDADGNPVETTITLKDYIDELNNDAKEAQEQGVAAEVAARCFLSYGA